jgi:hypothetical protein
MIRSLCLILGWAILFNFASAIFAAPDTAGELAAQPGTPGPCCGD